MCVCVCASGVHLTSASGVHQRACICRIAASSSGVQHVLWMPPFRGVPVVPLAEPGPVARRFTTLQISNRCSLFSRAWLNWNGPPLAPLGPRFWTRGGWNGGNTPSYLVITPCDIWLRLNTKSGRAEQRRGWDGRKEEGETLVLLGHQRVRLFVFVGRWTERKLFWRRSDGAGDVIIWLSSIYMLLSARRDDSLGRRRSRIKSKGRSKDEAIAHTLAHTRVHTHRERHRHTWGSLTRQAAHGGFWNVLRSPTKKAAIFSYTYIYIYFYLLFLPFRVLPRFMSAENMFNSPSSP